MLEGSEKNFQKALDDAAKADQNLASLLLSKQFKTAEIAESSAEYQRSVWEKKFSKMLDDEAKSGLKSRLFAGNDKLSATQEEQMFLLRCSLIINSR